MGVYTLIYTLYLHLYLHFAVFDLLKDEKGKEILRHYYHTHAAIAVENGLGFILESATWRANRDWAEKLGHSRGDAGASQSRRDRTAREVRRDLESEPRRW